MRTTVSHKSKQFFALVIKLAIVIGAAYFIYNKLAHNKQLDLETFISQLKASKLINTPIILTLFLATFCNWFLEILKWKTLVSHIKQISIWESTSQSLGGLTASLLTPNRVGEYGAKALYFNKSERKHIVGLNFLGNFAQLFVTLLFGLIGFSFFVYQFHIELPWYKIARISVILGIFGLFFFLGTRQKRFQVKGYTWENLKNFIQHISQSIHLKNISFSIVRYLIFSHQFYFLILLFGNDTSYATTMSAITAMYLITSIIPMLFIFDVIVKGSVAVWLFGYLQITELHILSIVALMWVLNFVIPSIVGSYFVLSFNPSYKEDNTVSL
ncbi:lysylphosphatidylglycerol synthase domain-containing protein [uncultured Kordia sp.]|uniref:lysylphosphatidylglycerol synthase domain-containing protein n=1 Tax=uncultured Kordia sp. TaxID=507699 RepID=UPI00261E0D1B|nr:lysylphosphatidylglycerol synthase domain-containing protein [uncultured Kordia sp.]